MIDTEKLREVADFQDFAEHADLIRAAAIELDDLALERDQFMCRCWTEWPQ